VWCIHGNPFRFLRPWIHHTPTNSVVKDLHPPTSHRLTSVTPPLMTLPLKHFKHEHGESEKTRSVASGDRVKRCEADLRSLSGQRARSQNVNKTSTWSCSSIGPRLAGQVPDYVNRAQPFRARQPCSTRSTPGGGLAWTLNEPDWKSGAGRSEAATAPPKSECSRTRFAMPLRKRPGDSPLRSSLTCRRRAD
jgi:hypothetical protein